MLFVDMSGGVFKRIEEAVLALLTVFSFEEGRAWKGFDFEIMNRLHERGLLFDPVNKNKSVVLTNEGLEEGRVLAERLFGVKTESGQ